MFGKDGYFVTKDGQLIYSREFFEVKEGQLVLAAVREEEDGRWTWKCLEDYKLFGSEQKEEAQKLSEEWTEAFKKKWMDAENTIVNELKVLFKKKEFSPKLIDLALDDTLPEWKVIAEIGAAAKEKELENLRLKYMRLEKSVKILLTGTIRYQKPQSEEAIIIKLSDIRWARSCNLLEDSIHWILNVAGEEIVIEGREWDDILSVVFCDDMVL